MGDGALRSAVAVEAIRIQLYLLQWPLPVELENNCYINEEIDRSGLVLSQDHE